MQSVCRIAKTGKLSGEGTLAGADNVTVTLDLLEKMAIHPLTQKTLDTFKADWESLFGEGMRVANMTE